MRPVPFPLARVIHWATTEPRRPAIKDEHTVHTYGDLLTAARRLAAAVQAYAGPGDTVAVVARRGAEPVIGALACWLGGQIPALLDAAGPAARIRRIIEDAGVAAVLQGDDVARGVASIPQTGLYVIHTSGSTGTPKGVLVGEDSFRRLLRWHCRAYGVGPDTRASLIASPGFDASLWETWPYLCSGAMLHVVPEQARLSPHDLADWYVRERIDISFLPPPLAEAYLQYGHSFGTLRQLLVGGDVLRLRAGHPLRSLVNHYGPTEATVVAACAPVPATFTGVAALGRAIPSARLLVLDPQSGLPTTEGRGELAIGGACLSAGYLHRADLTGLSFAPIAGHPGRWYRTGDAVRRDDEGVLWFEGRLDRQIKIRGVRVEPAEIEAAFLTHPAVGDVAVEPAPAGELTAFVVRRPGRASAGDLRAHVARLLPTAMVPRRIVELDALPLGPSGKIDRAALAALGDRASLAGRASSAGRTGRAGDEPPLSGGP